MLVSSLKKFLYANNHVNLLELPEIKSILPRLLAKEDDAELSKPDLDEFKNIIASLVLDGKASFFFSVVMFNEQIDVKSSCERAAHGALVFRQVIYFLKQMKYLNESPADIDAVRNIMLKNIVSSLSSDHFNSHFWEAMHWVYCNNLLSLNTLEALDKVSKVSPGYLNDLDGIIEITKKLSFTLNSERLSALLCMAPKNRTRLCKVVSLLNESNLLTERTFEMALNRIKLKKPFVPIQPIQQVQPSLFKVVKHQTEDNDDLYQRSELKNARDHFDFASDAAPDLTESDHPIQFHVKSEAQKLPRGGFWQVSQGYDANDPRVAKYAVRESVVEIGEVYKRLREVEHDFSYHNDPDLLKKSFAAEKQFVINEAAYSQLLGREAVAYIRQKRFGCVSEWQSGKTLSEYTNNELIDIQIDHRLSCFYALCEELNRLHCHFRLHTDLKDSNVVLDLEKLRMKLIDFGDVEKQGRTRFFDSLRNFYSWHDPTYIRGRSEYLFSHEIYSLGLILSKLFPDLFDVKLIHRYETMSVRINKEEMQCSPMEVAIIELYKALTNPDANSRPTTLHVLEFCNEILQANKSNWLKTIDRSKRIARRELCRKETSVEDALRLVKRGPRLG